MKPISVSIMLMSLLALTAVSARAQAEAPKFKVGDHVEFSENSACLGGQFAVQSTGTIVKVNPGLGGTYVIERDTRPGSNIAVPIYYQRCGMRSVAAAKNADDNTKGGGPADADNTNGQPAKNDDDKPIAKSGAKFKVNDRVEFSANNACLGSQYAIPTKGTIEEVNPGMTSRNYVILADPLPGQAPRRMTIPMAREECGMRALGGSGPKIQTDKLALMRTTPFWRTANFWTANI